MAHDGISSDFVELARAEVEQFLAFSSLHSVDSLFQLRSHLLDTSEISSIFCIASHKWLVLCLIFLDDAEVSSIGDVTESSNGLQLSGTLIDREDTSIAVETLALVLHDETRTTMNRNGIVSILISELRVHTLCQWSERISQTSVALQLGTLLWSELAVALNVLECLVNIYVASSHVEQ